MEGIMKVLNLQVWWHKVDPYPLSGPLLLLCVILDSFHGNLSQKWFLIVFFLISFDDKNKMYPAKNKFNS